MKSYFCILLLFILASCSIQSQQYDIIKSIINDESVNSPRLSWAVEWSGGFHNVYAVNNNTDVYFINKNVFLHFDGWELIKIEGLLDDGRIINMKSMQNEYVYASLKDNFSYTYICEDWLSFDVTAFRKRYVKQCYDGTTSHQNYFEINDRKQLVSMSYKILPNEENINIYLDKDNFEN
jgi:hypothetical protein